MQDSVRFCPQCGSANVDFSTLVGGSSSCKGCSWKGSADDLLVVPIQHDFVLGKESIITDMMNDIRKFLSGDLGLPYLKFLLKWGFLEGDIENLAKTLDRKKFARYLATIGHAVLTAVIAERARLAREAAQKAGADEPTTN